MATKQYYKVHNSLGEYVGLFDDFSQANVFASEVNGTVGGCYTILDAEEVENSGCPRCGSYEGDYNECPECGYGQ